MLNNQNRTIQNNLRECPQCREIVPLKGFGWSVSRLNRVCKECMPYRSKNGGAKAKRREYNQRLYVKAARKARSANISAKKYDAPGTITMEDVLWSHGHQLRRCFYCKCDLGKNFELDHKNPLSRGGSNYISNVVLTCQSCNRKKHAMLPGEFMDYMYRVGLWTI